MVYHIISFSLPLASDPQGGVFSGVGIYDAPFFRYEGDVEMLSRLEGFSIDGVDFFRDDDNPDMFHYIPTNIELATGENGKAQFQFVLYQAGLPIEGKEQGG